jgi:prolyl-tRNA synthetase
VSTRLIGGLIMTHSDDQGLVIPPKLAPNQVVIVPIYFNDEQRDAVLEYAAPIVQELNDKGIRVKLDDRDNYKPGWKFNQHEVEGVPLRVAVGPRDIKNDKVELARRDTGDKTLIDRDALTERVVVLLDEIQQGLYDRAQQRIEDNSHVVDDYETFKKVLDEKGGFIYAHWDGTEETEAKIKEETKATIRCIPLDGDKKEGKCMVTGKPSKQRVIFARAY